MRAIERNVFVKGFRSKSDLLDGPFFVSFNSQEDDDEYVKAKFIIELPERSVTITESEFDEVMDFMRKQSLNAWVDTAKEKLFGEERK